MRSTTVPVLIVGGGIGGLAAALALANAGHEVRLIEQAPEFAEVGAGLQLAPNATRALRRLGLLERVEAEAVHPRRLVMMDAVEGSELAVLDVGDRFRERYHGSYVVLHRADLLTALLQACREHDAITLENDRRVVDVHVRRDASTVDCEDGSSYTTPALVGADGLRSRIREELADDAPNDTGYVAYRGPVPAERVGSGIRHDSVVVWVGPGLHLVQYPLRHGQLYNQVAVFRSARFAEGHEEWGMPDELVERFSAMCPQVAGSVGLLDQSMRWPMHDREPLANWTICGATLLGDAAHPMLQYLAQGACQALEDAVELGAQLLPGRDPNDAFLAYQAVRIPRTTRVQLTARKWGELWHLDGVGRDVRNRYLRMRAADDFSEIDWLYGDLAELPPVAVPA